MSMISGMLPAKRAWGKRAWGGLEDGRFSGFSYVIEEGGPDIHEAAAAAAGPLGVAVVAGGGGGDTHESDEQEEDLEAPAQSGDAVDVPVAHGGHGDHEEVHAVPVAEGLRVVKVGRIALVLQLVGGEVEEEGREEIDEFFHTKKSTRKPRPWGGWDGGTEK